MVVWPAPAYEGGNKTLPFLRTAKMNALIAPVTPLASAIADLLVAVQTKVRRFMNSECTPTWTDFMKDCNKN
jgi:hypothetical protein